ncbi:MAG: serine--tRNA ligase [Elusimicrobia bacterium]|nr:serine--tRNA ligase [Elusimicrobiota bacterium]
MMDLKLLRANPEQFRQRLCYRNESYGQLLDRVMEKDKVYRAALAEVEQLRSKRNEISSGMGKAKAEGQAAVDALMAQANSLKAQMQEREEALAPLKSELDALLLEVPNLPHESTRIGKNENENAELRRDVSKQRNFAFKPKDHHELGEKLGILDFAAASLLSGSRFALLRGQGARLERALINFMLDRHTRGKGYTEILPPFMVTAETMTGTGQLPKFEQDLYKLCGETPMYMIPTAEVPLTNLCRGAVLKEAELPLKLTAWTPCFRQEAGSYGKDTRGLIRNHQFNKVELVWISRPEDSMSNLEQLTRDAADILAELELPHRVMELCTGDIGFAACRTHDLEVWMPSENRFREISSCSNCWDFQARRMNARFKRGKGGAPEFVHTLNGSGLAVGRTLAAVLENFQNEDGSVTLPKALVPYFGGEKLSAG